MRRHVSFLLFSEVVPERGRHRVGHKRTAAVRVRKWQVTIRLRSRLFARVSVRPGVGGR
jgi:hypothetical protein